MNGSIPYAPSRLSRFTRGAAMLAAALVATGGLSACGTTYGTGVSQEKQTLSDVYNMFTLKQGNRKIDYSARPDLIVPENKQVLPQPVDTETTASNPEWPETPDERIARLRKQAGEVDAKSGDYSIEDLQREKEGIGVSDREVQGKFVPGLTDRDGNELLYQGKASLAKRDSVLRRRAELEPAKGASRKYLTEPPVEYRVPADSAPSGEAAYTEEEIALREEEAKKAKKDVSEVPSLSSKEWVPE